MIEDGFKLNVTGDYDKLLDAVRDYDWGDAGVVRDIYWQKLLDSRWKVEDNDSEVCMGVYVDGLDHLAALIQRWLPVASELSLWAAGESDEAIFSIGMLWRDKKYTIEKEQCTSRLKSKQGQIAESAHKAYRILQKAFKEENK